MLSDQARASCTTTCLDESDHWPDKPACIEHLEGIDRDLRTCPPLEGVGADPELERACGGYRGATGICGLTFDERSGRYERLPCAPPRRGG